MKRLLSSCFYVILITLKIVNFQPLLNDEKYFLKEIPFDGTRAFGVNQAERPVRKSSIF